MSSRQYYAWAETSDGCRTGRTAGKGIVSSCEIERAFRWGSRLKTNTVSSGISEGKHAQVCSLKCFRKAEKENVWNPRYVSLAPHAQLDPCQPNCLHFLHDLKLNSELLQCISSDINPTSAFINDAFALPQSGASDATHFHPNLSMQRAYFSPWLTPPS